MSLRELYERVTGRRTRRRTLGVDASANFAVTLLEPEPLAMINAYTIRDVTTGITYNPVIETPYAYAGDELTMRIQIINNGGDGIIWCRISDADTGAELGYIERHILGGGFDFLDFPTFIMPDKTFNILIEAGH